MSVCNHLYKHSYKFNVNGQDVRERAANEIF